MELVTITHPKAGEARVPASAVRHWVHAGWKPAYDNGGQLPSGVATVRSSKAEPVITGEAQDDKAPRGRRKTEGDES